MEAGAGPGAAALRCSFAAEARGDPLVATAPHAEGFLLIEEEGAWGRDALRDCRLDPEVTAALRDWASRSSLRMLLIRPPERSRSPRGRRWAVVDSRPGSESIRWGALDTERDLLDIPHGRAPTERLDEPWYLVCTHGRHDVCCALKGRPTAAALAALRPGAVWHCSHVGGDRFAANVLVLPHGLYYGRVLPQDGPSLIAAQERGEVMIELLRGRTMLTVQRQAAQHFARVHLGSAAIDDLDPVGETAHGDGRSSVELAVRGAGTVTVTVHREPGPTAGLLTCHATQFLHPPVWVLDSFAAPSP